MKIFLGILFLALFSTSIYAQNLKALDDKYGFREAKFEMPLSSFKNLELPGSKTENFPNMEFFTVTNIDLNIGEYMLHDIIYWFYKGKLSIIEITVSKGYLNQQGVLKVLEAAYGKGVYKKTSLDEEIYTWRGEKVEMDYTMGNDMEPTGDIQITCKKLQLFERQDKWLIEQQKDQKILDAAKKL